MLFTWKTFGRYFFHKHPKVRFSFTSTQKYNDKTYTFQLIIYENFFVSGTNNKIKEEEFQELPQLYNDLDISPAWNGTKMISKHRLAAVKCTPVFCPNSSCVFVISSDYSIHRVKLNPESKMFESYDQFHQSMKPNALAVGPQSSLYISFQSAKAYVSHFFPEKKLTVQIAMPNVAQPVESVVSFINRNLYLW